MRPHSEVVGTRISTYQLGGGHKSTYNSSLTYVLRVLESSLKIQTLRQRLLAGTRCIMGRETCAKERVQPHLATERAQGLSCSASGMLRTDFGRNERSYTTSTPVLFSFSGRQPHMILPVFSPSVSGSHISGGERSPEVL